MADAGKERTPGQRLNVIQIEKTLQDDTLRAKITEKDIVALMPTRCVNSTLRSKQN